MSVKKTNRKIFTIISHEYLIKVKSKGFIIGTFLGPLAMLLIVALPGVVAYFSADETSRKIAILDKTQIIGEQIVKTDTAKYFLTVKPEKELLKQVIEEKLDGYLVLDETAIQNGEATVYSLGGGGLGFMTSLEKNVGELIKLHRLKSAGASETVMKLMDSPINIISKKVSQKGEEKDYSGGLAMFGYILGFAIYMLMFIYGMMVMRGVIEEKSNRIVEIIASSAKPFEIMMGKVIGIGLVGLTQVSVWALLSSGILFIVGGGIATLMPHNPAMSAQSASMLPPGMEIPPITPGIAIAFIFYFLAGYFIYSTLFAAVGSAVDQEQDAQNLQLPITLPIIIPIMFIFNVMSNPDGNLAIALSLFPLFTPILMIVRIAAGHVPAWQIIASVILEFATFFGALWLAAKVYRIGILSYGKKPTFKEIFRWIKLK